MEMSVFAHFFQLFKCDAPIFVRLTTFSPYLIAFISDNYLDKVTHQSQPHDATRDISTDAY